MEHKMVNDYDTAESKKFERNVYLRSQGKVNA